MECKNYEVVRGLRCAFMSLIAYQHTTHFTVIDTSAAAATHKQFSDDGIQQLEPSSGSRSTSAHYI